MSGYKKYTNLKKITDIVLIFKVTNSENLNEIPQVIMVIKH